eukprot:1388923-Lingulodinium_polyedra.AAC.1
MQRACGERSADACSMRPCAVCCSRADACGMRSARTCVCDLYELAVDTQQRRQQWRAERTLHTSI